MFKMTARIKKILKDHLDTLATKDLWSFQWYMANMEEGSGPIPRSKLEKLTTEETVDKLVQTHGADGAVGITMGIFYEMKNNDLASKLLQAITGQKMEQQSHEPLSSPARETQKNADSTIIKTPRTIRENREAFERVKQFCDSSVEHTESQRRDTEKKIKDDFEKLHLFLKTEEEARIAALEEEETQKICMMQKITEMSSDTFSLSDSLKDLEDLGADDSFIEDFRTHVKRAQNALPDPQQFPRTLIDVSQHVENLQFRVLEKMLSIVKHTPVVLDPNTASPWLTLSDDLTTVTFTDTWKPRPGNPECNTSHPQVLGCEGFESGKHCWKVAVGNQTRWILGVAEEAVDRKEGMWATPQKRLFTLMNSKRGYKDVKGNTLKLPNSPKKIRIELDYENGTVSFHDAENNTSILTYEEKFTQKLYPYFAFVKTEDDNNDDDEGVKRKKKKENSSGGSIKICKSKVSLTMT